MSLDTLSQLLLVLAAAFLTLVGKVLYDRRFTRRPDVRFAFELPATFGVGEKARVYQNFQVSNAGTEAAQNVRIVFRRPMFDLVEHQIQFDGEYRVEREDDRAVIILPSLLPTDRVVVSFLFSPDRVSDGTMEDALQSVRASNCVGQPQSRREQNVSSFISGIAFMGATFLAGIFVLQNVLGLPFPSLNLLKPREAVPVKSEAPAPVKSGTPEPVKPREEDVVRFILQSSTVVQRGKEAVIEAFIDNVADDPFIGWIVVRPPSWPGESKTLRADVSVGSGKRQALRWTLPIPPEVLPGRYQIVGNLVGRAFEARADVYSHATIEVK